MTYQCPECGSNRIAVYVDAVASLEVVDGEYVATKPVVTNWDDQNAAHCQDCGAETVELHWWRIAEEVA